MPPHPILSEVQERRMRFATQHLQAHTSHQQRLVTQPEGGIQYPRPRRQVQGGDQPILRAARGSAVRHARRPEAASRAGDRQPKAFTRRHES
jgi:hypothetical protein